MGASGAGKTTFLNTLSGRSGANLIINGQIKINRSIVSPHDIKKISAYVQQQDLFLAMLTVREHLLFQAVLRMDNRLTSEERQARVDEVIKEMSLKKCQYSLIGSPTHVRGISGGEMKRLSFASEILMDPPLLFVDEPTSGLDTFMAQSVIKSLQDMAHKGRTILCTIHQPSSEVFMMFNRLLLFAEGKTAYLGDRKRALGFFEKLQYPCPKNYNPADFYIHTLAIKPQEEQKSREKVKVFTDAFEGYQQEQLAARNAAQQLSATVPEVNLNEIAEHYGHPRMAQFKLVMWRTWLTTKREPLVTKIRLLQTLAVAIFVGLLYLDVGGNKQSSVQNVAGALFFIAVQQTFGAILAIIQIFPEEKSIFLRDHENRMYKTWIYFLTKSLAEIPFQICLPLFYTLIVYYLVGLNNEVDRFFIHLVVVILVSTSAQSLGYLISSIVPSTAVALAIAPITIVPFMLFGGLLINSSDIPKYFLPFESISWIKYGFQAFMENEFKGRRLDTSVCGFFGGITGNETMTAGSTGSPLCFQTGKHVLDFYKIDSGNITRNICILLGLAIGFRVLSYIFMQVSIYRRYRHTRKQ